MKQIPPETLAECLDLLEQGLSVDEILSRFPEHGEALRSFLETAVRLSHLAHSPTLAATRRSRNAVLQEVDALGDSPSIGAPLGLWLRRALAPAVAFAVLLLLFAVALPRVSASALPGDSLYGGKRLVERAQLFLAASPERRETLQARFNDERIREVEALLNSGRQAQVQFEGEIGEIASDYWTVAGIRVNLGEETTVEGEPWLGARTLVQGRTQEGRLLATRLVVFGEPPPAPEPTPAPTMTATPSPEATPTATPSPTPTPTETPGPTPTDTLEPVPSLTPPPPASTIAPPPPDPTSDDNGDDGNENDDDDNENGDDGNDNDGGDDDNDDGGSDDNDNGDDGNDNDDDNENDDDGDDDAGQNDDDDENEDDDNGNEGDDD